MGTKNWVATHRKFHKRIDKWPISATLYFLTWFWLRHSPTHFSKCLIFVQKLILKKLCFLTHLNFYAKIMKYSSIQYFNKFLYVEILARKFKYLKITNFDKTYEFLRQNQHWVQIFKNYFHISIWRQNSNSRINTFFLKLNFRTKNWIFGTVCASKRCKKWPETKDTQKMPQVRCSLQFYLLRHLPENWQQWIY